jgi:hypothetical protein
LLERTVGELRDELQIGHKKENTGPDYFYFGLWVLLVLFEVTLVISVLCFLVECILH